MRLERLRVYDGGDLDSSADWILRGIISNERYVEPAFDELVAELRATEEWRFVDREIDIRLERSGA